MKPSWPLAPVLATWLCCAVLVWTAAWSGAVMAVEPAAAKATPTPSELAQPEWTWRGKDRFTYFGFEVYDATLWTSPGFEPTAAHEHELALELQYLRNFEAKDIAQRSIQEMRRIAKPSTGQEQAWMAQMLRVFPNIRKGDRLLGVQRPGQAAVFWHNGQLRGEIADPEFAKLFFGIWLSPRTSAPAFRARLLGLAP
jgi:hypothetical protein